MATIAELLEQRVELVAARRSGVRAVGYSDGANVQYRSDAELAAAIANLDREIATAQGRRSASRFTFNTSKGLDHA